jgi:transposase
MVSQEFDIPEIKFQVTEHRVEKKKCSCGYCNIAPNASKIKNYTYYGDHIRGLILNLKNQQMLPFYRTK